MRTTLLACLPSAALLVGSAGGCSSPSAPPAPAALSADPEFIRQVSTEDLHVVRIVVDRVAYNGRLDPRPMGRVRRVVLHCTETSTAAHARWAAEHVAYPGSRTGNSGHFYIGRDGTVTQYVDLDRTANHVVGHNDDSIGIELVNRGRAPHWTRADHQDMTEGYPPEQIDALVALLGYLDDAHPSLEHLTTHAALDQRVTGASDDPTTLVRRRLDPGPQFPLERVLDRVELAWWEP